MNLFIVNIVTIEIRVTIETLICKLASHILYYIYYNVNLLDNDI